MLSGAGRRIRERFGEGAGLSLVLAQAFPGVADAEVPGIVDRARSEHGFAAFELVPAADPAVAAAVRAVLDDGGSRCVLLAGLPLLRARATLSGTEEARRRGVAAVQQIVLRAAEAGAEAVMVTSGPRHLAMTEAGQLAAFADSLVALAAFARREAPGVRIRIEPTDTELQHRQLVGPTPMALALVAEAAGRGETVDLNLDLSHLLQLGEVPQESLALARDHCRHIHLANVVLEPGHALRGDRHPAFGTPGSLVDVPRLGAELAGLRGLGYLDPAAPSLVGLEVIPEAGGDPWETLARAVDDLGAALEPGGGGFTPGAAAPRG